MEYFYFFSKFPLSRIPTDIISRVQCFRNILFTRLWRLVWKHASCMARLFLC